MSKEICPVKGEGEAFCIIKSDLDEPSSGDLRDFDIQIESRFRHRANIFFHHVIPSSFEGEGSIMHIQIPARSIYIIKFTVETHNFFKGVKHKSWVLDNSSC